MNLARYKNDVNEIVWATNPEFYVILEKHPNDIWVYNDRRFDVATRYDPYFVDKVRKFKLNAHRVFNLPVNYCKYTSSCSWIEVGTRCRVGKLACAKEHHTVKVTKVTREDVHGCLVGEGVVAISSDCAGIVVNFVFGIMD